MVQTGVAVVSQPVRQSFRFEPPTTGKLCDVPVHPLSRSVPLLATVTVAMLPPPAGFAGHFATGGGPVPFVHRRTSVSGSFFGFPSLSATTRIRFTPGLFCFLPLSGTENDSVLPQLCDEPSVGSGRLPVFTENPVTFACVQPVTGSLTQSATSNVQLAPVVVPFARLLPVRVAVLSLDSTSKPA